MEIPAVNSSPTVLFIHAQCKDYRLVMPYNLNRYNYLGPMYLNSWVHSLDTPGANVPPT